MKEGIVDHYFSGPLGSGLYYCDGYSPDQGYWMTPIHGTEPGSYFSQRRNVSERAVGPMSTFQEVKFLLPLDQMNSLSQERFRIIETHKREISLKQSFSPDGKNAR